jgi:CRP-like cAMP-binding protein
MPLGWLNTPLDADIGELIAQRKRGKAIETLRRQLQGRLAPPVGVRLQLADLLMQAGRIDEAVPVLLGLATEFAADGFVAKAVAILKRVDRVQPGRADIAERLERLVHQQKRVSELPSRPRAAVPEFGIEEFAEGQELIVPTEDLEPEGEEPPLAARRARPWSWSRRTPSPPWAHRRRALEAAPHRIHRESRRRCGPGATTRHSASSAPCGCGRVRRTRPGRGSRAGTGRTHVGAGGRAGGCRGQDPARALAVPRVPPGRRRRGPHSADVRGDPTCGLEPVAPPAEGAPVAIDPTVETAPEPAAATTNVVASEPAAADPSAAPAAAVLAEAAAPSDAPGPSEPIVHEALSEDAFRDHLLDIVEDVLHRPAAPAPAVEMDRARVLDLARRMVASRLFKDLSDEELLAIVRGLRLHTCEAGDIVVTEGEPGQSLFTLTTGHVKVFVRNPDRRNFEVAQLGEGDFFGEISSLSGRPRSATVVAASACELLELDRPTLDSIARTHARVRDVLETSYIERASSPEVAAVRAVPLPDSGTRRKAIEVLESHFGESRWDPRMRLRLADLLLKAGKEQDAVPILIGLADELARAGFADKAVAILKKIEQVQRRNVEVVNLAPLLRAEAAPAAKVAPDEGGLPAPTGRPRAVTDDRFHGWLVDLVRDSVGKLKTPEALSGRCPPSGPTVRACSPTLFEDFSEEELVAFIRAWLLTFEPETSSFGRRAGRACSS